ncbi:MAG: class I SAM-dependent methyltransferase [Candidatus Binatia bacterium]
MITIAPLPAAAYDLLAAEGFGTDLFNPTQHRACELVELYALHLAIDLAGRLGSAPATHPAVAWVRDRIRLAAPRPPVDLDTIRAEGLATDPAYAPAYALLDAAAAILPQVARGETTGERALLGKVALWVTYFSNTNPYYALNNRVAARAAAARVGEGTAVLEVGAGLGSASEALLEELAARGARERLADYVATEPVAFFRRRAERTLTAAFPGVPLRTGVLDVNQPWAAQHVAPGTFQLVWGVNVFHLARDLDTVLREAYAALAPGGWLVVGEGMRPFADRVVGAELPFRLLESFVDVTLDPLRRPTPGFLTAEHWIGALVRAGFAQVAVVPDAVRLRAIYPGFLAAAVCGRRV